MVLDDESGEGLFRMKGGGVDGVASNTRGCHVMIDRALHRLALGAVSLLIFPQAVWGQAAAERSGPGVGVPPAVQVAGILIALPKKAALLVLQDQQGNETGSLWVDEGETVQGYRVASVETDHVSFVREGRSFVVLLGYTPARTAPSARTPNIPPTRFPPAGRGRAPTPDRPRGGTTEEPAERALVPGGSADEAQKEPESEVSIDTLAEQFREQLEETSERLRERSPTPPAPPRSSP